jgi:hypothetical protein
MKDAIPPDRIRAELDKILASPGFAGAGRLGPFLRYVIDQTLAGRSSSAKPATTRGSIRLCGWKPGG